jgi:hypothetical protein
VADEAEYIVPALADAAARIGNPLAVENRKPREAVLAMEMLADGKTHEEIKKETGLTFSAIASLRARHETAIEDRRKQLAADGFAAAEGMRLLLMQKQQMLSEDKEAMKKANVKDLALSYAILQDKGFSALGESTKVVIEHKGKGASLEDAMAAIAAAKAQLKAQSIPVDVTPVRGPDEEDEEEDILPETA